METKWIGKSCPLEKINAGTCFAFQLHEARHLGLKLIDDRFFALLWSHYPPEHPNLPCCLFPNDRIEDYVWAINDAVALAPSSPDAVRARRNFIEPGSLLVSGTDALVAVPDPNARSGKNAYANLSSGVLVERLPQNFIWFENWSIEIRGPDDYRHFCNISTSAASAQRAERPSQ